ncbi:MAG: hypothetical protein PVI03_04210 [Candidatus Thorarchaeota archaeon]|jgi:hypothetical protein
MRPPNEISLRKEELDMLMFVIQDRLELLNDLKSEREFDDYDTKEEKFLLGLLEKMRSAGLKWKKLNDGMWETHLPEGNQVIRVEM